MKFRYLLMALALPLLICCGKGDDTNKDTKKTDDTPVVTPEDDEELPPEIHNGDKICVTNPLVEQFLTEVNYPDNDYSYTDLLNYSPVCPGNSDKPQVFTIRWAKDESAGALKAKLWEATWSREFDIAEGEEYVKITNLLPNTHYHYLVTSADESKTLTSGEFDTEGHVHQLYFVSTVRNVRDLGGWKTADGTKMVKYRMIYRGGRMQPGTINAKGIKDALAEGIRAQLDLRGKSDVLEACALGPDYDFCNPVIEEGYTQLLRDDQAKAKQCMEFIFKCVKEDKPVYFHCSLGRDRTGTIAMLVLGTLGVREGDISKEYELTQFAPFGWSVSTGESIKMTRKVDYKGAATYIWTNFVGTGETFQQGIHKYLVSIGIQQADINTFCNKMLVDVPAN